MGRVGCEGSPLATFAERQRNSSAMTVWIYVNTSKEVGDEGHLKVFASEEAAERWFADHDPEGVAFEYPVVE
jgi:hypothetical protein